jgi:hypothetical protein
MPSHPCYGRLLLATPSVCRPWPYGPPALGWVTRRRTRLLAVDVPTGQQTNTCTADTDMSRTQTQTRPCHARPGTAQEPAAAHVLHNSRPNGRKNGRLQARDSQSGTSQPPMFLRACVVNPHITLSLSSCCLFTHRQGSSAERAPSSAHSRAVALRMSAATATEAAATQHLQQLLVGVLGLGVICLSACHLFNPPTIGRSRPTQESGTVFVHTPGSMQSRSCNNPTGQSGSHMPSHGLNMRQFLSARQLTQSQLPARCSHKANCQPDAPLKGLFS